MNIQPMRKLKNINSEQARLWQSLSSEQREIIKQNHINQIAKKVGLTPWEFEFSTKKGHQGTSVKRN